MPLGVVLEVKSLTRQDRGIQISWQGHSGWTYAIQYMNAVSPKGPWNDLANCRALRGQDGVMSCVDTNATGISLRTYRIIAY